MNENANLLFWVYPTTSIWCRHKKQKRYPVIERTQQLDNEINQIRASWYQVEFQGNNLALGKPFTRAGDDWGHGLIDWIDVNAISCTSNEALVLQGSKYAYILAHTHSYTSKNLGVHMYTDTFFFEWISFEIFPLNYISLGKYQIISIKHNWKDISQMFHYTVFLKRCLLKVSYLYSTLNLRILDERKKNNVNVYFRCSFWSLKKILWRSSVKYFSVNKFFFRQFLLYLGFNS